MYRQCNKRRHFNSQPHEEADVKSGLVFAGIYHFNSQPHEEADLRIIICVNFYIYFNSQPHEEADFHPT